MIVRVDMTCDTEAMHERLRWAIGRLKYENQWPGFCRHCDGTGRKHVTVPTDTPVSMTDVESCDKCSDYGICPRCGHLQYEDPGQRLAVRYSKLDDKVEAWMWRLIDWRGKRKGSDGPLDAGELAREGIGHDTERAALVQSLAVL